MEEDWDLEMSLGDNYRKPVSNETNTTPVIKSGRGRGRGFSRQQDQWGKQPDIEFNERNRSQPKYRRRIENGTMENDGSQTSVIAVANQMVGRIIGEVAVNSTLSYCAPITVQ